MTAYVRKSKNRSGVVPQWGGGRLPLSSKLSELIRIKLEEARKGEFLGIEMETLQPLLLLQQSHSIIPSKNELLIENVISDEGHHIFIYPFEGRFVHEVLSAIIAYRIAQIKPSTFSIAMNDYGFELLSDQEIPIEEALEEDLFSMENLMEDIEHSINQGELAKRKFREIATISGLVFHGYPGKKISNKHLQASSSVIYNVFEEYDKNNLLIKQAKDEVITLQLDINRLIQAFKKINQQKIVLINADKATPFSFPIMAERLRERFTNEKLMDRLLRIQKQLQD
jgi:ATP-dependent Lhr-like helicase